MRKLLLFVHVLVFGVISYELRAAEVRIAVTSSFNNSGLSDVLLPVIKQDLDLDVQVLVVGTGQALKLGRAGDVDAILVHSKEAEEQFVKDGFGTHRREIMYNDFVIIGPSQDTADIAKAETAISALRKIMESKKLFVSRGDDSGTHKKEVSLWETLGMDAGAFDPAWYRSVGAGMGAALNTASGMNAYIISDRASWLNFANKGDLKLLFHGDPELFNQYTYIAVNPARHSHVKIKSAKELEAWLVGERAQKLIGTYSIDKERLFTPNAKKL